jgi:hypothetical protein
MKFLRATCGAGLVRVVTRLENRPDYMDADGRCNGGFVPAERQSLK